MKKLFAILLISSILFLGYGAIQTASAQELGGGVDVPGDWYVGEGLKKGDYFSYDLCHVDYKECADFQMDIWIEGDITVGSETKWLAQAVVYDGIKIVKGNLELGKIAPEPTGGSPELGPYRGAFKSSIVWLSAFATSYGGEGPKEFSLPSWGKIGNIGGQQVRPTDTQSITVPGGTFDTVLVTWYTGGRLSQIWVVDEFPFPVKADTFTHVAEGIPPREYQFSLLEYKENVSQNPFSGIISTAEEQAKAGCPVEIEKSVSLKKPTKNFDYQLNVIYGPEDPSSGCNIEMLIKFLNKFDETEFLNQVQYDVFVVDENLTPIRSIAQDEGRRFLYSPSGQAQVDFTVKEGPGIVKYAIWIYGLAPESIVPTATPDYLLIEIPIAGEAPVIIPPTPEPTVEIPSWIKNNARWWADGQIDDNSFVQGIQFMIQNGIMKIPPTSQVLANGVSEIPDWIRNNAGWWADDLITDNDFVQGIQYLIEQGIMRIA